MIMRWFMMAVAIVVFSDGGHLVRALPLLRDPDTGRPCELDCTKLHLRLNPEGGSCPVRAADCGKCLPGYQEHFLDWFGTYYEDCFGQPEQEESQDFKLATPKTNNQDLEVLNTSPKTSPAHHGNTAGVVTDPFKASEQRERRGDQNSVIVVIVVAGVLGSLFLILCCVGITLLVTHGNPQQHEEIRQEEKPDEGEKLLADVGARLIGPVQEVPVHDAHQQPARTNLPKQCVAGEDENSNIPLIPSTKDISSQMGADEIHHEQEEGEEDVCACQVEGNHAD